MIEYKMKLTDEEISILKGEQGEVEIEGIKGHRDAIIDGAIGDVKSASAFSYKKFEEAQTNL